MRSVSAIVLALALSLAAVGCTINPATGQRQFNVLSTQKEIALGQQASPQFLQEYGGEVPSTKVQAYVSDLGQRLAAVSERPDLPWEFHVVDSSVINAFALPGGKVFISRGLVEKMENEAQLAGVLGHEIGHVTAQHIGQQMTQQLGVNLALIGLGVAAQASEEDWLRALGIGASVGGTVYLLKFGRDQESQADELGLRYMTRLGYNPVGQLQVMEILKREAGVRGGLEILSTHPLPETRIDRLNKLIRQQYPDYEDFDKYKFHQDAFQRDVLAELKRLPPAKHNG